MNKIACTFGLTAALLAAAWSPAASAQAAPAAASSHTLTGNVNLVSQYRYRGIEQTAGRPAVQGGFDYAHASGLYVGTWASNVSWLSDFGARGSSLEWDFYGGYKTTFGDLGVDVGVLRYYYPMRALNGATAVGPNTTELYVAGTWKMLTLKYSHSVTDIFGFQDSEGSGYLDLTGNFEVGAGFTLVAHVGRQRIASSGVASRAAAACDGNRASYTDYKLGVTREVVGMTVGLAYVGTNARDAAGECYFQPVLGRELGKGTAVLTVGKTF